MSKRPLVVRVVRRALKAVRFLPVWVGYGWGPRFRSQLRKAWVLFRHPNATIKFGRGVYLGPGFSLHIPHDGHFIVGDDVEFRRNFRAEITGDGRIVIGSGCYFTYDVILACSTLIEIGERCGFANESAVYDADHRYQDTTRTFLEQGFNYHEVRIADDAQVHQLCTILSDIGERSVIGANSVVSRPIPPYVLAVGAPARPVNYFGPPGAEPEGMPPSGGRPEKGEPADRVAVRPESLA